MLNLYRNRTGQKMIFFISSFMMKFPSYRYQSTDLLFKSMDQFLNDKDLRHERVKDFLGQCDQICRKLKIWSHLLKKFLMENVFKVPVNWSRV